MGNRDFAVAVEFCGVGAASKDCAGHLQFSPDQRGRCARAISAFAPLINRLNRELLRGSKRSEAQIFLLGRAQNSFC